MCRLLAVRSDNPFLIDPFLDALQKIAVESEVDQGDGWGVAYKDDNKWTLVRDLKSMWESNWQTGKTTTVMLAHARSAFHEHEVAVENNMPFVEGNYSFIFNGELHGVKIKEAGNTGAEKIFNLLVKLTSNGMVKGIARTLSILKLKSDYIKASNFVISDGKRLFGLNFFNENSAYFTMYKSISNGLKIISSEQFGEYIWERLETNKVEVL